MSGKMESFFAPTALDRQLSNDDIGKSLRIDYRGERVNPKTGRTFKDFVVSDWIVVGETTALTQRLQQEQTKLDVAAS
jgi:hypothetical protein